MSTEDFRRFEDAALSTRRADGVLHVRIERPARRNALTSLEFRALADVMEQAVDDEAVRVVL